MASEDLPYEWVSFRSDDLKETLLRKIFRHLTIDNYNFSLIQVKLITPLEQQIQAPMQNVIPSSSHQFYFSGEVFNIYLN